MNRSRLPPVWICAALALGTLLSVSLFVLVRDWEQRELNKRAADLTQEQVERLRVSMLRSMEVLHSIVSLHAAEGRVVPAHFRAFAWHALERQPELQALSWNPVVPSDAKIQFEAEARMESPGFHIRQKDSAGGFVPASERVEYVPVYLIEPLAGNSIALGYDLNSDPGRQNSLAQARDSGEAVATAPLQLAQGPGNEPGVLVVLPAYQGATPRGAAARRKQLAGFAVAVFRIGNLVGRVFDDLKRKGIAAELREGSATGELIYANNKNLAAGTASVASLEFAGRLWAVRYLPTAGFASASPHAQSALVLAVGLAFSLLTAGYLYGAWRKTVEIGIANNALRDEVTVRQRAERAAAAANQAKSDFLASMSHEIRTPLNAILGYTQIMRRDADLRPEQQDSIRGIHASGCHLLGVINEILDLSKIEAGCMEISSHDFDLASLSEGLGATFRPLCAQKRISFNLQLEAQGHTYVRGDEGKLRQILINLVGNAVKFTSLGEVRVSIQSPGKGRWLFEVIDTGLGIPEEEHTEIFRPFHQGSTAGNHSGTGLGLAIAQRQVELMGGQLKLHSERGAGSRFYFEIPLEAAEQHPAGTQPELARLASDCRIKVMVVDDREPNREVIGGMLAAVGCDITRASTGGEALALAGQAHFDLIFLDLLMPGMSGEETARQLLSLSPSGRMKIIAHTAAALPRLREAALAAGCVDFISKPIRCERLYECLETHAGARFEEIIPPAEPAIPVAATPEQLSLPDDLCRRLALAAELHSTTALKSCLQELRQLGPDASHFAEEIRHLMRGYDMDGIQRLLARIGTGVTNGLVHS
ncbi:MAG TPA: CHASE domain-containing protein [Verrucomicrobiae bacterium]|nr:CHASE domain-containing protein [Verrucomicrobiae bacterium]